MSPDPNSRVPFTYPGWHHEVTTLCHWFVCIFVLLPAPNLDSNIPLVANDWCNHHKSLKVIITMEHSVQKTPASRCLSHCLPVALSVVVLLSISLTHEWPVLSLHSLWQLSCPSLQHPATRHEMGHNIFGTGYGSDCDGYSILHG